MSIAEQLDEMKATILAQAAAWQLAVDARMTHVLAKQSPSPETTPLPTAIGQQQGQQHGPQHGQQEPQQGQHGQRQGQRQG